MVRAAINKLGAGDSYRESIAMLDYAANLDDVYNFSALYNRAYAKISQGYMESQQKDKAITYWQNSAADDLAAAKYRIEGKILPQLVSLQLIANQNPQSALFKQVTAKIKILQKTNQYIDSALKTIASSNGNVTKIDAPRILNELFSPHHPPIEEINEMGAFGIVQLFKVEVVERQVNPLEVLFVGILAFAQVVIGTICVHTGMVSFGVNMISNGIQDMIKASELASGNLSIKNYFVGKGIELAVFALTVGIEKVASLATSTSRNAANQAAGQMTQSTADAIVKNALLTTAVGIGVDYAISGACEVASKIFEDDVQDAVHRQVHTAFEKSHLRQDLAYIWLVDGFTSTNRGERAIEEAISDTLMSKRSLAATMAEQTLTAMSHSTSASIKAIGYAARIAKASCDITKITEFTEDFCESFAGKVGYIKSRLPTIGDLMYKDMRLVNRNDAPKIMEILEQHSVMIHGHIQPDYAQKLSGVELDDAVHVRLSAFVNKLAAAGSYDTNSRLNRLEESITECLTSRVLGQIHTQITTPLAREGTRQTGLIDRISDKIEEGAAQLRDAFNKSRIENGARIVDLNTISNNAKAAWVNPDDDGIGGGSDKTGAAAGDSANGQEEVEGLPWLKKEDVPTAIDEQNATTTTKKPPPVAPKPKPPTLSKKAAEDGASQGVIAEIKAQEQSLGQPSTNDEQELLALLSGNPVYFDSEGNAVVIEGHANSRTAPSFIEQTVKKVASGLVKNVGKAMEAAGHENVEIAANSMLLVGYTAAAAKGASSGALVGSTIPGVGTVAGSIAGAIAGIAQQAAIDTVTDEGLRIGSHGLQNQFKSLTPEEANLLAAATLLATGGTKATTDWLKKTYAKSGSSLSKFSTETSAAATNNVHMSEVKTPLTTSASTIAKEATSGSALKAKLDQIAKETADNTLTEATSLGAKSKVSDLAKKFEQSSSVKETTKIPPPVAPKPKTNVVKQFEKGEASATSTIKKPVDLDTAIPESHIAEGVKYEGQSTFTARDVVVENPHTMKHYANKMEEITAVGAIHDTQIPLLKDVLREQEFVKLDQASQLKHRTKFGNLLPKLREEWSAQTGKEWPVYKQNYFYKTGKQARAIGDPLDGHHIIPVSHGGPNTWWNMHPAHFLDEHPKIHSDPTFKDLFNSKIKK